ncbi:MAG: LamG domain-containing protein [Velocimicrobium sp.]
MNKKNSMFRIFSVIVAFSMMITSIVPINVVTVKAEDVPTMPAPFYEFTFEDSTINEDIVHNMDGLAGTQTATIATGAAIVENTERGSHVLSLPGGDSSQGYLTLPTDLFSQVGDQFSLSFWIKLGSNSDSYSRIFQTSSTKLGTAGWPYSDPEFCIVKGGGNYDSAIKGSTTDKCMLSGVTPLNIDEWQYISVSVTKDSYLTYVDGIQNTMKDNTGNLTETLRGIFKEISGYHYNSLGQSVYTDKAPEALYDDFRFYNEALTQEQVVTIYTKEYGQTLPDENDKESTLNFDISKSLGDMFHGSTGFLYGVSEVNVPSIDLITAIKPKILVQKAADGKQHPTGDAYRLTSYMKQAGVENLQIYLQDYYLEWPYEYNGIEDYRLEKF